VSSRRDSGALVPKRGVWHPALSPACVGEGLPNQRTRPLRGVCWRRGTAQISAGRTFVSTRRLLGCILATAAS
jgi:hypothetical protein